MRITDERVRAMLLGRKAFRVIAFPGQTEITVAVRVLTDAELDACRVAGQAAFIATCERRKWDPLRAVNIDPTMHTRLVDRQIIVRAFFDADTIHEKEPKPFFPGEADVAELDGVTTNDLMRAYLEHQEIVNPGQSLGLEEVDAIVDALGKGRPEAVLRGFERSTLETFTLSLVRLHRTSQTGKSSTS